MSNLFTLPSSLVLADADQRLERAQRQFRQAERMAGIGTWRLTIADDRCEWSDQVFAIHGLDVGMEPALEAALDYYPPESRTMVAEAVARTIATGEPFTFETDLLTARGERRRVRCMGEIELHVGLPVAVFGVFQDITDHYALEQRLARAAATDDLTGMANRGAFKRHLGDRIIASRTHDLPLALLLIDLDGFKAVNDAFGHLVGDDVLCDVASELASHRDADCFPARIGGDEFAVVVAGRARCARLDATVDGLLTGLRRPVTRAGRTIEVSASMGVAWLCDAFDGSKDLIASADAALYEAKRHNRGVAHTFRHDGAQRIRLDADRRL